MGLIKAGIGAVGGVLADQWKEFFYCENLSSDILVAKGRKRTSERSSNTSGEENIISNGSRIAVNDGQCMIIVEQGKVVDICAEPGEYTYDQSTEPSIFTGNLGENIKAVFKLIGKRFTFGGDTGKDQRIYYFNTKEIIGNKYGTASPVPFRIVDERVGLDVDIAIRCFGEYSYRLTNPILFYTNVCGNVADTYTRDQLDNQLKTELLTALQPAFAKISAMGIRYSALPAHAEEMSAILNQVLTKKWRELRGIEIVSFGISSATASEEDEKLIKTLQHNMALRDPALANAHLIGAQADALRMAASNESGGMGAAFGLMGMNMVNQVGAASQSNLFALGQQQMQNQPAPASASVQVAIWKCTCGQENTGNFCTQCGQSHLETKQGWKCICASINQGQFCSNCGKRKPTDAPLYQCDKCGWKPEDPQNPPKFCPNCGDAFDEKDIR